jgi:hypothetical protein
MQRWIVACALVLGQSIAAYAQTEDVEPRTIGGAGVTTIGVSGFVDRFMSTEETFPYNVEVHADLTRFLTSRLALRGGLLGSGRFGDDEDDESSGPGAAALHALVGAHWYFTPESMASFYAGGEYRAQVTRRPERDAGTVLGKAGFEAAVSARARVFVEAGYGMRLTRGTDDERQTRIVGEIGFRIKF